MWTASLDTPKANDKVKFKETAGNTDLLRAPARRERTDGLRTVKQRRKYASQRDTEGMGAEIISIEQVN